MFAPLPARVFPRLFLFLEAPFVVSFQIRRYYLFVHSILHPKDCLPIPFQKDSPHIYTLLFFVQWPCWRRGKRFACTLSAWCAVAVYIVPYWPSDTLWKCFSVLSLFSLSSLLPDPGKSPLLQMCERKEYAISSCQSKTKEFGAYSKKEYHFGIWIEQLQAKCQAFTQKRQYLLGFVPKKF